MNTEYPDAVERAESLLRDGMMCSQAVLMAFAPRLGMDERQAARVASAFGAGMARHGWTCGAMTGALMAIGLHAGHTTPADSAARDDVFARAQAMVAAFEARHGAMTCRQLVGANLLDPVERQAASDSGIFTSLCPQLVRAAATLVADTLAVPRTSPSDAPAGQ